MFMDLSDMVQGASVSKNIWLWGNVSANLKVRACVN